MVTERDVPAPEGTQAPAPLTAGSLATLGALSLPVRVRIGSGELTVEELLRLAPGAVVTLDQAVDDPVEVLVGERVVARGDLVSVGDEMGVRITQIGGEAGGKR